MLEIKIDPQLPQTQDPPLVAKGGDGGRIVFTLPKADEGLATRRKWWRRKMHSLRRVNAQINVEKLSHFDHPD